MLFELLYTILTRFPRGCKILPIIFQVKRQLCNYSPLQPIDSQSLLIGEWLRGCFLTVKIVLKSIEAIRNYKNSAKFAAVNYRNSYEKSNNKRPAYTERGRAYEDALATWADAGRQAC